MNVSGLKSAVGGLFREGALFRRLLREMRATEKYSYDDLIAYQCDRLEHVARHASRAVRYWRHEFATVFGEGAYPTDHRQLLRLPLLHKALLRDRGAEFRSRRVGLFTRAATSGTTGTPLQLYRDRFSVNLEHAMLWRLREWAGVQQGDRRAILRGDVVADAARTTPPFWRFSPDGRELILSSYHLSAATLGRYLEVLRRFEPSCLEAYPSSAYTLARLMRAADAAPLGVKGVITSSEMLFDHQKEIISARLGRVFDYYGNAERVAFLPMCEQGRHHYAMDYSILEFSPAESGDGLEMIGTSLHNRAMPLFRYVTGDLVRLGGERCACGRAFPVIESIEGRQDDFIQTPSGRWIGRLGWVPKGVAHLLETQIVQERLDFVRIRVVTAPAFGAQEEAHILKNFAERVGHEVRATVERVDSIERTGRGKFKLVVSLLPKVADSTR